MMAGPSPTEGELLDMLEPLVLKIAQHCARTSPAMAFEDYLQVLRLEAVRAIRKWSPEGSANLWTYTRAALVNECLNTNRNQRPRGYREGDRQPPAVLSLDVVQKSEEGDTGDLLGDTIPGPDDTAAQAGARYRAQRAWELAEELLLRTHCQPRLLAVLELYVGRRGTPLLQSEIAQQFGCTQMTISRCLRRARALLLADPRSEEFTEG